MSRSTGPCSGSAPAPRRGQRLRLAQATMAPGRTPAGSAKARGHAGGHAAMVLHGRRPGRFPADAGGRRRARLVLAGRVGDRPDEQPAAALDPLVEVTAGPAALRAASGEPRPSRDATTQRCRATARAMARIAPAERRPPPRHRRLKDMPMNLIRLAGVLVALAGILGPNACAGEAAGAPTSGSALPRSTPEQQGMPSAAIRDIHRRRRQGRYRRHAQFHAGTAWPCHRGMLVAAL